MYQVKFNSSFPLDASEARVSRPVFHVPTRSKYVFVAELSRLRGSDASNVHDEEPAEYEIEFSDDEAEAAYKAKLRNKYVFFIGLRRKYETYGTGGMLRANRAYLRHRPMYAIRT